MCHAPKREAQKKAVPFASGVAKVCFVRHSGVW